MSWGGAVPEREGMAWDEMLAYFFFGSISVFLDLIFFPIKELFSCLFYFFIIFYIVVWLIMEVTWLSQNRYYVG